jgi:PmbA protein
LDPFRAITSEEAGNRHCSAAALETSRLITNSEGAGVRSSKATFFSAHSKGFVAAIASLRRSIGAHCRKATTCSVIAWK